MSAPGRNDPCSCGSGKKYKRCCLLAAETPTGAYTVAERQSAQAALGKFGWRHEFDEERERAESRFWGGTEELVGDGRMPPEVVEQGEIFFQDWFTSDFRLESGHTLLELLLEREGRRLRPGEVRYLSRARLAHLRPYEVIDVRPDEGLDLLDLWAKKRLRVHERLGTRQLVQWDVLAARVMLGEEGIPVLDGMPYLYPATAKDAILKDLRSVHRRFRAQVPGDDVDFFKRFGSFFFLWWLQYVAVRPRPQLRTAEGDEFLFVRAVFDVRDRAALDRALAGHPDLARQDDGSYAWHEPETADGFRRGLGAFVPGARMDVLADEVVGAHRPLNRTLVIVNTVRRAVQLYEALRKRKPAPSLVLVHSRFRPQDRRRQVERLLADVDAAGTIVVSTQVIEAGVDVSATTLFTELAPWPSLVQRFGRCNRRGDELHASIRWIDLPDEEKERKGLAAPYAVAQLKRVVRLDWPGLLAHVSTAATPWPN